MGDAATLLAPDGKPAAGRDFAAGSGLALSLNVPAGRRLARIRLQLAAADASELTPEFPALVADSGPMAGKADAPWLWAGADWGQTRALVGLILDASPPTAGALSPARKTGARVRLFSGSNWLPLAPLDTLPAGTEQRFPAQCASRLMAEMLIEGDAAEKRTGVLIPGALTGRRIGLRFTRQPCLVSLAIGDDPPFFSPDGPLPAAALDVPGLARAANRYLGDHPDATAVPLLLRAANAELLRIVAFEAELEAPPRPTTPPEPPVEPTDQPRQGEREHLPAGAGASRIARLCSPQHAAAVQLAALPKNIALSSVALRLRPLGAQLVGRLSLHADSSAGPVEAPLLAWDIELAGTEPEAAWFRARLPAPLGLPARPWWLVFTVTQGEALWYADENRPDAVTGSFFRKAGGPWLPLDEPGDTPWLQLQAGVLGPITTES